VNIDRLLEMRFIILPVCMLNSNIAALFLASSMSGSRAVCLGLGENRVER